MGDEPGRGNGRWDRVDWNGMHDGLGWGGWPLMALFLMLPVALVIAIVVLLLARFTGGGGTSGSGAAPHAPGPSGAEQVLGEGYARGEIDEDDYPRAGPCCAARSRQPRTSNSQDPRGWAQR